MFTNSTDLTFCHFMNRLEPLHRRQVRYYTTAADRQYAEWNATVSMASFYNGVWDWFEREADMLSNGGVNYGMDS